ncbi:MAG: LamG-like jellyroll fold domain-containing protein [Candidatus Micrarchaeia archaeon]
MKNLKGFIFTLDAIFALIVAVAGISILLYVHSTVNTAYSIPTSEASSILENLISMKASDLYSLSIVNNVSMGSEATATWPQFGGNQSIASHSAKGPKNAYTIFAFNTSNAVIQSVIAGRGMVFGPAGSYIFALNGTNGRLLYTINGGSTIDGVPALYNNEIILANASGFIAGASIYNGTKLWSHNIGVSVDTPIEIEDGYIAFGAGTGIYLANPYNGSIMASNTVAVTSPLEASAPVYFDGEFLVTGTGSGVQNYIYAYALAGSSLVQLWKLPLSTSPSTAPMIANNTIIVGSGSSLYAISASGTVVSSYSLSAQVLGLSYDGSNIYAETSSSIQVFNSSGAMIFSQPTVAQNQYTTPSTAQGNIYTLINGYIYQAYNISTGAMLWNTTLPTQSESTYANIALAYGNAYIASGTMIYALGSVHIKPYESMLDAIVQMYLNGQGELANNILHTIYPSQNIGIYINNTYGPSLNMATFNGSYSSSGFSSTSYIFGTSHHIGGTNYNFTVTMWVKPYPNPSTANSWTIPFFSMESYQALGFLSSGTGLVLHRCTSADTEGYVKGMSPSSVFNNQWHFVAVSVSYPNYYWQFDGNNVTDSNTNSYSGNYHISIGAQYMQCDGNQFNGQIANVQLYNTALKPQQIMSIYKEGIFGTPIGYQNLSGWWPLTDSFNDYSGSYGVSVAKSVASSVGPLPPTLSNAYLISKASMPLSINVNGTSHVYNVSVIVWR